MKNTTAPHRALIVIDVQNEYVSGNLRIEYPPVEESLSNIGQAMDAATQAGIPIIVVQQDAPSDSPLFALNSEGWALHPVVASRPYAQLIHKRLPSAFTQTKLSAWLQEHDIDTLSVVGYMTHNCNASTINHALHDGFTVEYLADASGSLPYVNKAGAASAEEIHRVYCVVFQSRFAAVLKTQAWIEAVQAEQRTHGSNIYESNQRALRKS